MDTKKLFEYEYLLESMRPALSDDEMVTTARDPEPTAKDIESVASFVLVPSNDGVYLKVVDKEGNHKKLMFLNPLVAKSLASTLIANLSAQGYIEDDLLEVDELDQSTLH